MSPLRMRELESQIMFKKPVEKSTTTTESTLSDYQKAAIEDFEDMMTEELYPKTPEEISRDVSEEQEEGDKVGIRNRRGIPGGVSNADPKSPEIKEYVEGFLKGGKLSHQ